MPDAKDLAQDAVNGAKPTMPDQEPDSEEPCPIHSALKTIGDLASAYEKTKNLIQHPSLENAKDLLQEASKALKDAQGVIPLQQLDQAAGYIDKAVDKIEQAQQVI